MLPVLIDIYSDSGFKALIQSLHTLDFFAFGHDGGNEYSYQLPDFEDFWMAISTYVFTPAISLQSLSIGATEIIGVRPPLALNEMSFPLLEALRLDYVLFDGYPDPQPVGTEDFIVRHGRSLRRLELVHCMILVYDLDARPERLWTDVWTRFEKELGTLDYLKVSFKGNEQLREQDSQLRYISEDHPHWFYMVKRDVPGEETDRSTLEMLMGSIRARGGTAEDVTEDYDTDYESDG